MNELLAFALLAFTSFFTLMNPLGVMPIFMTMTGELSDQARTPLAIPMITGPGAITNAIILMQAAPAWNKKIVLVSIMALVCLITFIVLWSSSRIMRVLGETGNKIMMRLMGLIVMVIAVEFFFSGLRPILRDIFQVG